jgi:hypothetical protein
LQAQVYCWLYKKKADQFFCVDGIGKNDTQLYHGYGKINQTAFAI